MYQVVISANLFEILPRQLHCYCVVSIKVFHTIQIIQYFEQTVQVHG